MAAGGENDGRVPLLHGSSKENINDDIHEDVAVDSTEYNFRRVEEFASNTNNNVRNLIAYWVLGLCNNYAYVIMLSAAHDILTDDQGNSTYTSVPQVIPKDKDCNNLSTGTILLADVLPSLMIKTMAPFIAVPTFVRMTAVLSLSFLSFITVALSPVKWLTFIGVVFASLSSGLGELTLLSYSARFHKNVVSTWSSGTGASGVIGSLSYAGLIAVGLTPKTTLLAMSVIPVTMAFSFFCLLKHPSRDRDKWCCTQSRDGVDNFVLQRNGILSLKRKFRILKGLISYMLPLSLVYFAEYFINQGLMEHIYFPNSTLNRADQYRWFQVDYQLGVFVSRSSVNFVTINKLWALPFLQFLNLVVFVTEAIYAYMPSIWIIIALVFFEGLLGGAAYVNTFYKMTQEVPEPHREFSLGAASMADSIGISIAGAVALPVHSALCNLNR